MVADASAIWAGGCDKPHIGSFTRHDVVDGRKSRHRIRRQRDLGKSIGLRFSARPHAQRQPVQLAPYVPNCTDIEMVAQRSGGGGTMHLPLHCGDMRAVDAAGRNCPLLAMPVAQVASRRVTQLQGTSVMKTPYPPQGAPNRGGKLQPPENSGRCDRPTIPNRVSPNLHSPPHDLRRRISSLPWASHRRDGGASPYGDDGPLASRIEPA